MASLVLLGWLSSSESASAADKLVTIHRFAFANGGYPDGRYPNGDLVIDADGSIYGTTQEGGEACPGGQYSCGGTIFRLSPKGKSWKLNTLHSFTGGEKGATPRAGLLLNSTGMLLGTTYYGGDADCRFETRGWGCGTIFAFGLPRRGFPKGKLFMLHAFSGDQDGRFPDNLLSMANETRVHGTTKLGAATPAWLSRSSSSAPTLTPPSPRPKAMTTSPG
ncbi:hypothetical protein IHQ68_04030 [Chelatococcus sambhunathii]|uniref:Delta-60 repeat domain n=1 Tax=Chelatococcus sambhunathii TaxID=363953 RepID=A0ABU1DCG1_9HYPH|nr:choice-of-anchor tandem repeat GloVer-containing protein [Chelatococcus sambhunathii]MDR4305793.1 hypothetical protein [Chelatococcus sambhunathii]